VNKIDGKSAIGGLHEQLEKHFMFAHCSSSPASVCVNCPILNLDPNSLECHFRSES
jgi:hypothetical protein